MRGKVKKLNMIDDIFYNVFRRRYNLSAV